MADHCQTETGLQLQQAQEQVLKRKKQILRFLINTPFIPLPVIRRKVLFPIQLVDAGSMSVFLPGKTRSIRPVSILRTKRAINSPGAIPASKNGIKSRIYAQFIFSR